MCEFQGTVSSSTLDPMSRIKFLDKSEIVFPFPFFLEATPAAKMAQTNPQPAQLGPWKVRLIYWGLFSRNCKKKKSTKKKPFSTNVVQQRGRNVVKSQV